MKLEDVEYPWWWGLQENTIDIPTFSEMGLDSRRMKFHDLNYCPSKDYFGACEQLYAIKKGLSDGM